MTLVKPCARCVMIMTDPAIGGKSQEPRKTLATFRQEGNEVLFGRNLLVHKKELEGQEILSRFSNKEKYSSVEFVVPVYPHKTFR